jgi:hypothetical protein
MHTLDILERVLIFFARNLIIAKGGVSHGVGIDNVEAYERV